MDAHLQATQVAFVAGRLTAHVYAPAVTRQPRPARSRAPGSYAIGDVRPVIVAFGA